MGMIRIWNPQPRQKGGSYMAHREYHVHRHHRRNPFGIDSGDMSKIVWGSAGFVAARAIPAMAMSSQNSGVIGYAMNFAVALAAKLLVKGDSGDAMFVGGTIATVSRIVSDTLGSKISGLSGDPAFTLGAYWQSYYAVPTISDPYGRTLTSPYPNAAAALPPATAAAAAAGAAAGAAAAKGKGMGRFGSGRFG